MDSDIEYDEQETGRNPLRERMKQLESENAALKAKAEQAAEAERELAFVKAGIDPNSPLSKYFIKGYDGDLNPDAIKAAALEAQIIGERPVVEQTDVSAWNRTNEAASGTTAGDEPVDFVAKIAGAENPAELEKWLSEARKAQSSL
jgi:Tfp pilus assembly protein PilX